MFSLLKKIYSPLKPNLSNYGLYFFGQAFDGFQSIFVSQIAAYLISSIENKSDTQLIYGVVGLSIFSIIGLFISWLENVSHTKTYYGVANTLYTSYLTKYVGASNTKTEKLGTGKTSSIINKGIEDWITVIVDTYTWFIVEITSVIYALIIVYRQIPLSYFLILLGLVILMIFVMYQSANVSKSTRKKSVEVNNEIERQKVKIIMSKFEIQQQNKIHHETSFLSRLFGQDKNLWVRNNHIVSGVNSINDIIMLSIRATLYLVIGLGVIRGEYQLSTLVLLIGIFGTISRYLRNLRGYITGLARKMTSIEKLWQVENDIVSNNTDIPEKSYNPKGEDIVLDAVSFAYEKKQIFSKFSLKIATHQKTAFVGPSGSGKTTLIKLLAGYISPDQGDITVLGEKLSEINLQTYYPHIGYLTQDPSVFDGTILENLLYGVKNPQKITQKKIKEILLLAKCDFVFEFEKRRDTEIGERGVRLSGGQKQRLAIAKIMLKDPQIVFLDEPTSAMDSFNEEEVTQALQNLFANRTVIVVAHRLQTVKEADQIYYLEASPDGAKIVEQGTHNELVRKNGKYKKMLDLQSGF